MILNTSKMSHVFEKEPPNEKAKKKRISYRSPVLNSQSILKTQN